MHTDLSQHSLGQVSKLQYHKLTLVTGAVVIFSSLPAFFVWTQYHSTIISDIHDCRYFSSEQMSNASLKIYNALLKTYHRIDNPHNKWTYNTWIVFKATGRRISSHRKMKIPHYPCKHLENKRKDIYRAWNLKKFSIAICK